MKNDKDISEDILSRGKKVFGSEEKFRAWYNSKIRSYLNKKRPK